MGWETNEVNHIVLGCFRYPDPGLCILGALGLVLVYA